MQEQYPRLTNGECMKKTPVLIGYNFSPKEANEARDHGRLLSMRLETSAACNLRCIYCNGDTGRKLPGEISLHLMKNVIRQGKSRGARSVVVIGGGEPTVYPYFRALIRYVNKKKMIPVVITNGLRLTADLCSFLYDENASVLFKLDSLDENVQDCLAAKKGAFREIMKGVENLFAKGFNKGKNGMLRCGASFVVTAINLVGIPEVWRFCRENNLYPNMEELIPRGRGHLSEKKIQVDKRELYRLKKKLLEIDRKKYGYEWNVYTPLPGHGCLQFFYSVYVTCQGYVRPCADVDIKYFNIRNTTLNEILRSPFYRVTRNIEKNLHGKCGTCNITDICHGCRGRAFSIGIHEGLDSYQAVCREDPACCRVSCEK